MTGNTNAPKFHHYSTTEQVVGTWFGKPLYEKTFVVEQSTAQQVTSIDVTALNVETMLSTTGACQLGSQADNQWITAPMFESGSFNVFINYLSGSNAIRIQASGWGVSNAYITARYTKTTDTV